jgi:hypothetical protein
MEGVLSLFYSVCLRALVRLGPASSVYSCFSRKLQVTYIQMRYADQWMRDIVSTTDVQELEDITNTDT